MRRTLTLPDGRQLVTHSTKRWHVLVEQDDGVPYRYTSSDVRSRALTHWREAHRYGRRAWLLDVEASEPLRTPDYELPR